MNKHLITLVPVFVCTVLISACQQNDTANTVVQSMEQAQAQVQAPMQSAAGTLSGTVMETMDAGGYTYVQLDTGTEKVWAAGPASVITPGSTLTISTQMPMANFRSEAMQRDFDLVYFVGGFGGPAVAGNLQDPHSSLGEPPTGMENPHGDFGTMPELTVDEEIEKVEGGKSIAEILAQQQELSGQSVRVRGKVVKYTQKVLGKDWIHIRDSNDGSDLTITTTDSAALGDIILVEGTVSLNKDYGYGYVYDVIMEDARVTVE